MKLFKRKVKEKEMDENLETLQEYDAPQYEKKGGRVDNQVIDYCEQMIETAKELEDVKAEYKIVTSYLNDIQLLEDMSGEEMKEIREAADNVVQLSVTRDAYLKTEKKLTDAQFMQMELNENEIPDAIKRLQSNEAYQSAVSRDMKYLQSERDKWSYCSQELRDEQISLRRIACVVFGIAVAVFAVLLVLQVGFAVNTQLIWMLVIFAAGVGGFFIFMRLQDNEVEIRQSDVNRNHAITLLNKMKLKYVNATNAVDYACEKYHVRNSEELNRIWELYMDAAKEKDKYMQTNEDLEYFNAKLIKALKNYRLYDARVWTDQARALVDNREMVEVKHNLIERRQKLRQRIETGTMQLKEQREITNRLLEENPAKSGEIKEILNSIDRLSGI